ncbi:MAG: hypothetical protein HY291_22900 [Planctomycetes bacterium]|nr:hypothetical protein [Planctomycetota bacterium]
MLKLKLSAPMLAVGLLVGSSSAWAVMAGSGATSGSGGGATRFVAGKDTTYSWTRMDINAARKAGKPILLYIYDSTIKNNTVAKTLELNIFPDKAVKEALQGFTFVMCRTDDKGWPVEMLDKAKEGAACYILLCDGTVVGGWWKNNLPNAAQFAQAAQQAAQGNQAAADRMAKAPPPKFEQGKPAEVAAANPPKDPQDKPADKAGVPGLPGLGDDGKEKAKKTEDPAKKKTDKGKVDDE